LESSVDGQLWQEIDRQENNIALNAQGAIATFPISRTSEVQMIHLRQLGRNSSNAQYLMVSAIELFGVLIQWRN
jgi:hypothetical protein